MKKTYKTPQISVVSLHVASLIALSGGVNNTKAASGKYTDDKGNSWDNEF